MLSGTPQAVAIPNDITRITQIYGVGPTSGERIELKRWKQVPTAQTNLLYLDDVTALSALAYTTVNVFYEYLQRKLSSDLAIATAVNTAGAFAMLITGGTPAASWVSPGYVELSIPFAATDVREVVRYDGLLAAGFTNVTRGVEGHAQVWTVGTLVSAVYEAPESTVPLILAKAHGNMTEAWIRHRDMYAAWSQDLNEIPLAVPDLIDIASMWHARAAEQRTRVRDVPTPSHVKTKGRRS